MRIKFLPLILVLLYSNFAKSSEDSYFEQIDSCLASVPTISNPALHRQKTKECLEMTEIYKYSLNLRGKALYLLALTYNLPPPYTLTDAPDNSGLKKFSKSFQIIIKLKFNLNSR